MKKETKKDYLFPLLLFILIVALLASCTTSKVITGEITAVNSDTVTVQGKRFKVLKNVPVLGQKCTFTPTKDSSKVNCIKLK